MAELALLGKCGAPETPATKASGSKELQQHSACENHGFSVPGEIRITFR